MRLRLSLSPCQRQSRDVPAYRLAVRNEATRNAHAAIDELGRPTVTICRPCPIRAWAQCWSRTCAARVFLAVSADWSSAGAGYVRAACSYAPTRPNSALPIANDGERAAVDNERGRE